MELKYYRSLDGIRGIAALIVVIFHFFTYPNSLYLSNLDFYHKLTWFGQHGVTVFFVLSGFVITRILLKTRENENYFTTFYKKRALRIFPLYYLFLIIYFLVTPLLYNSTWVSFKLQLPLYFYLQNFSQVLHIKVNGPGHLWSLAVEEHFYLLWPLAIYLVKPKHVGKMIALSIIVIFLLKYFMLERGFSISKFTFTRIDDILLGAYLSELEFKKSFLRKNIGNVFALAALSVIPLSSIVYVLSTSYPFLIEMSKFVLVAMVSFSLIGFLILYNDKKELVFNRILCSGILQYLGRISYGIYVWHILALAFLNKFFISKILFIDILITVGLTILLAHVSYYYYEIIFIKLKNKNKYVVAP